MKKLTTLCTTLALASVFAFAGCKKKEEAPAAPAAEKKPEEKKPEEAKPEEKKPEEKPAEPAGGGSVPAECQAYLDTLAKYVACEKVPADVKKSTQEGVDMAKQSWGMLNDPNVPPEAKKAALDGCTQGADALKQGAKALGCEI